MTASTTPKVELTQTQLFFPLPIKSLIENIVKIVNKDSKLLAFKIRTNAKGRYVVRPASAFLQPGEESMIKFSLDPAMMVVDGQAPDENCDDYFFMEVRYVLPEDNTTSIQAFWQQPHSQTPNRIRLPCKYIKGSDLPEKIVLRNTATKPSPRSDAPSPKENLDARASVNDINVQKPAIAPSAVEFVPLTRKPAAPASPQNLDFVADPFKNETPQSLLKAFMTFKFSLPVVLLFMLLAFLAAFIEEDTIVTRFLDTYVLGK